MTNVTYTKLAKLSAIKAQTAAPFALVSVLSFGSKKTVYICLCIARQCCI